jgi:hypothetical protein
MCHFRKSHNLYDRFVGTFTRRKPGGAKSRGIGFKLAPYRGD